MKPDLHPGWTGLNWHLQAGGSITRNIKGIPDELYWRNDFALTIDGQNQGTNILPYGYAYNYPINNTSDWDNTQRITDLAKAGKEPNTFWVEAEPDEYVFQCGEYSGKFYMDHNGYVRVQSRPDIKVEGSIIYNIPLFNDTLPLDPNNSASYTSVDIPFHVNGYPVYRFNRLKKAILMGFKITTPDGMQYEFGMWGKDYDPEDTFDEVEFTSNIFDQFLFGEIFTTWHLKKIIAPNKDAVEFFYEKGNPVLQAGRSFSFYRSEGNAPAKGFLGFIFGDVSAYTSEAKEELNGSFIRPTYLKRIVSKNVIVEFEASESNELKYNYEPLLWEILDRSRFYDRDYFSRYFARIMIGTAYPNPDPNYFQPGIISHGNNEYSIIREDDMIEDLYFNRLKWRKLDAIKIRSAFDNAVIDEWAFGYNNKSTERLQLLSLRQKGKTAQGLPPYTFEYNTSGTLPGYNSFLIDHWGYFNNRFAQVNTGDESSLINYKGLREPVEQYLYIGSLEKITTPTGGVKQFLYEPNKYKNIVKRNSLTGAFYLDALSGEKTGAGLRISQIIEKSGNGPDIVTTYKYGDGTLLGDIQYYWPDYQGRLLNGNQYSSTRFVTESLLPVCEQPGGGVVAYEHVTEEKAGNGKTVYTYSGFGSSPDIHGNSIDAEKSPYSPFTSKSLERGLLKEIKVYDNNDQINPVSYETYEYTANPGFSNDFIRSVYSKGISLFGETVTNVIEGTAYKHFLYPYQNIIKTSGIRDKNTGKYLITVENLTYDTDPVPNNDNQLKETLRTNSKGESIKITYRHPLDFVAQAPYTTMVEKNQVQALVEQAEYKNGTSFLQSTRTNFNYWGDNTWGINNANSIIVPQTIEQKVLNNNPEVKHRYSYYDSRGNILTQSKENDFPKTYVWDYNRSFPVAEVVNADKNAVYYTSFETSFVDAEGSGNWFCASSAITGDASSPTGKSCLNLSGTVVNAYGLNSGKRYRLSYWYKSGSSVTPSMGTHSNIITGPTKNGWTYTEREVTGTQQLQLAGTGYIDELRLHPVEAQMTTYTYDPLIGMTSSCDQNNQVTYYVYDDFGRLSMVKNHDNNILKMYCYNYQGQLGNCYTPVPDPAPPVVTYYSADWSGDYYSQYCSEGGEPLPFYVDAPFGLYTSTVSQEEADYWAQYYAQSEADAWGDCGPPQIAISFFETTTTDFFVSFYNLESGRGYHFDSWETQGNGTLGYIPAGTYDIVITAHEDLGYPFSFNVACGHYNSGRLTANFYNVSLNSGCNYIEIY
ncbi:DUF5977 domain-containing protein [Longitalea luteola]|uniref:DUF5977 domain-containing protein n=1 Tax=Longitalea luteola TaxID=2812563 RepID=UPI001A95DA2C|nr:hypothetical protein [Longitalea luteola]